MRPDELKTEIGLALAAATAGAGTLQNLLEMDEPELGDDFENLDGADDDIRRAVAILGALLDKLWAEKEKRQKGGPRANK